jgi:hypothetical protein
LWDRHRTGVGTRFKYALIFTLTCTLLYYLMYKKVLVSVSSAPLRQRRYIKWKWLDSREEKQCSKRKIVPACPTLLPMLSTGCNPDVIDRGNLQSESPSIDPSKKKLSLYLLVLPVSYVVKNTTTWSLPCTRLAHHPYPYEGPQYIR